MKSFQDYEDAVRQIRRLIQDHFDPGGDSEPTVFSPGSPEALSASLWNSSFDDKFRVFYHPKDPFLGFFDKVQVEGRGQNEAYTFSRAEKLDRSGLRELKIGAKRHFPDAQFIYFPTAPDRSEKESGSVPDALMISRIWNLARSVFSDAFLEAEQLSENALGDRLDALLKRIGDEAADEPSSDAIPDASQPSTEILRERLGALDYTGDNEEEKHLWEELTAASDVMDERFDELLDAYLAPPARNSGDSIVEAIELPVLRIEETRGNLRIILLVIPTGLTTKLTYYPVAADALLENPVTEYFWKYANPRAMARLAKHNHVEFVELQGWPSYPMCSYNVQKFSIHFGCYEVRGHPIDLLVRSGKAQFRTLLPLIRLLYLQAGADWNGRLGQLLPSEVAECTPATLGVDLAEKFGPAYADKAIRIYPGHRKYSMPLYDVLVNGEVQGYRDDGGRPFLVAGLSVTVLPFLKEVRPNRGVFAHEIVDESNK